MGKGRSQITGIAIVAMCAAVFGACADRTIHAADEALLAQRDAYAELDARSLATIGGTDEPGPRLVVLGRLVRAESGRPVPFRSIRLFHTDATGSYGEAVPGDEATARLQGEVVTDSLGRFFVATILPGDYGGSAGGHIHTFITGASPEYYDFHFRQYASIGLRVWARRSSQAAVLDLRRAGDELLVSADLVVRGLPPETGE